MKPGLNVKNVSNKELITEPQSGIRTEQVFSDTRAALLYLKSMQFEIRVELEVAPNIIPEEKAWRRLVETLKVV